MQPHIPRGRPISPRWKYRNRSQLPERIFDFVAREIWASQCESEFSWDA